MTREEAIRTLQFGEWWDFLSGEIGDFAESTLHEALNLAISALREQEERRWIPVTERLPRNYISVLVYLPGERPLPTVHEAYIGGDGEWHSSVVYGVENEDVTHWMPLPEPQKEDA